MHQNSRSERDRFPHITGEEYQKLLESIADVPFRLFLQSMWLTGSRVSEALAIRPPHLTAADSGFLLQITRIKRRVREPDELPVPMEFGTRLQQYIRLHEIPEEDPVFPYVRTTVYRRLKKIGSRVLDREISPHMFRHGRVYDLVARGTDPLLVARILGHVSIETTLEYFPSAAEDTFRRTIASRGDR